MSYTVLSDWLVLLFHVGKVEDIWISCKKVADDQGHPDVELLIFN